MAKSEDRAVRCSFCGKRQDQVDRIIAGHSAYICNECVDLCYQIINEIAREAGIEDRIGCHTLRKTFGYHYYKMTGDVVSLQRILCHSYQRETLVYIGVVQENIDESLMKFNMLAGKRVKADA